MATRKCPLEADEQKELARWLDRSDALWCHVPNGGKRAGSVAAELKRQGVKRGVPDVLIFGEPHIAIELKRIRGGVVSDDQEAWLRGLRRRGWVVYVCRGHREAIGVLKKHGYNGDIN